LEQKKQIEQGVRQFGRVNWIGLYTLSEREIMRFASIWMQSLLAPVVTAVLFVVIFNLAFGAQRGEMAGVPFLFYLAPGICMMMVIQNAFNNSSSSLLLAKIQGNIVDTLMPPLSAAELVAGYAVAAVARGAMVAGLIVLAIFLPIGLSIAHPLWMAAYVLLASLLLGLVGLRRDAAEFSVRHLLQRRGAAAGDADDHAIQPDPLSDRRHALRRSGHVRRRSRDRPSVQSGALRRDGRTVLAVVPDGIPAKALTG
jgi:hypothetical protein